MSADLTSLKNPRVKTVLALAQSKERAARRAFALEGAREIARALTAGFPLLELYVWTEGLSEAAREIVQQVRTTGVLTPLTISAEVFAKLAVREGSDGLIAVFAQVSRALEDLRFGAAAPLVLAVQGIEKPGNLGALLRSADGAGVDAVVCLDATVDLYNPHVLRTSLGTAFALPVVSVASAAFRDYCKERQWPVYGAALTPRAVAYTAVDYRGPSVLLLGEEATGLSSDWLAAAAAMIKIPMHGTADSLNVAAAGAIVLYEARRQRSL